MDNRWYKLEGATAHTAGALALLLRQAHGYSGTVPQWSRIADWLWSLPFEYFGWEVERAMKSVPRGYCATCGVGFAPFIDCSSDQCRWIDDELGNPSPDFTACQVNLAARSNVTRSAEDDKPVEVTRIGPAW